MLPTAEEVEVRPAESQPGEPASRVENADHGHGLVPVSLDRGEHGVGPVGQAAGPDHPNRLGHDFPDRLTGASSDVADKLQIHEMKVENGVMQMREVSDGLSIPAGGSVVFKPGSYHMMLIGLKKPLTAGEKIPLTLTFERAGNISVTVPVQAMGATEDKGGGMGNMNDNKGGGMSHMEMK